MDDAMFERLGAETQAALDGNMLIGSFAAELIDESYPVSKGMWDIIFKNYTDLKLGKKFFGWMAKSLPEAEDVRH